MTDKEYIEILEMALVDLRSAIKQDIADHMEAVGAGTNDIFFHSMAAIEAVIDKKVVGRK